MPSLVETHHCIGSMVRSLPIYRLLAVTYDFGSLNLLFTHALPATNGASSLIPLLYRGLDGYACARCYTVFHIRASSITHGKQHIAPTLHLSRCGYFSWFWLHVAISLTCHMCKRHFGYGIPALRVDAPYTHLPPATGLPVNIIPSFSIPTTPDGKQ